ncbi:type I restriction enzyme, S subunit [Halobacillus alkaliphilus]|uniref:Type I restriction enzyme, S subunit n=1 Tax=Halobacillus alkaliphilus TaxID=396056 RepID=A0A1I2MFR8_9BACI|nr:restriction endonuclease subunit S [Halobacillus alkaliphilus]SFF88377.1 type I restriction enzyme, S subunit [Halobacillus alkaliphilus]
MKKGWERKKLGDICSFINGLWKGKKPPYIEVGVIRNKNFTKEGTLDFTEIAYLDVQQSQYAKRKLEYGDIILEKSGGGKKQPVGRVVIFDKTSGDFSFSNFTSLIRIVNKEELDCHYLHRFLHYFYLSGLTEDLQKHSTGIRNLQLKEYKEIEVPIPPLSEQRRIVALIDKAFNHINKTKENDEKNLKNSRELFESTLQGTFANQRDNFKRVYIDDVCESIIDCINKTAPIVDESTPFKMIRTTNVKNGQVNLDAVKYVNEETFNLWTRRQVPKRGDVILTREAPLGQVGMIKTNDHVFLGQRLVSYRVNSSVLENRYLLYAFQSNDIQHQIQSLASGSTVQHMRVPDSKKLQINLPPLKKQQSIVEKLEALSVETKKLEDIYQKKLTNLDELRKSILQKAFNGEL